MRQQLPPPRANERLNSLWNRVLMHNCQQLLTACLCFVAALTACTVYGQDSETPPAAKEPVSEVLVLHEGWTVSPRGGGRSRVSLPTDRLEWAWL